MQINDWRGNGLAPGDSVVYKGSYGKMYEGVIREIRVKESGVRLIVVVPVTASVTKSIRGLSLKYVTKVV